MQISLRLILLLIGAVIVIGIIWDAKKNNISKRKLIGTRNRDFTADIDQIADEDFLIDELNPVEEFKEEINRIIILYIMAAPKQPFLGEELTEAFKEMRLYYGEKQIFHRYEHDDGTGKSLFSVVSVVEPGFFDLTQIEDFKTPGIALFFTLTQPNQSVAVFELMLRTAKKLAAYLDGELKDEQHRTLTSETIEDYRERVRLQQPLFPAAKVS